ncbi:hypothetical protein PRZ48_010630 [Zasmidium cellare]|uniref:F-box domain-containing protein n=1 Tax=Zasmidium cellare TaxID=395010 RepID=A0ABR0E983_ZASCE|nr:hypothetical protein PRZ48_010630 [Zasmidium cellare]
MKKLLQLFKTPAPSPNETEPEPEPLWKDQPKCGFLQLPPEIRNEIYSLVLVQTSTSEDTYLNLSRLCQPPLTATCRQLQHEGLPFFFAENRFRLTANITPDWHLQTLIEPDTWRWVRAAGADAKHLRQVRFFINRPGRPGRRAYRAMDLVWIKNPHFKTDWSLSIKKDLSDLPHCPDYFIASHWTKLAKDEKKRKCLTFEDVVGIGKEVAENWVPVCHRVLMRRVGKERVEKVKAVLKTIWPKEWVWEIAEGCLCKECRRERWEAKRVKKRREKEAKKTEKEAKRAEKRRAGTGQGGSNALAVAK